MTEAEWLAATDPIPMVRLLQKKVSNRKLRLFLVASARLVWDRITEREMRQAVEAAEQYADGLVTAEVVRGYYSGFYRYAMTSATHQEAEWFRVPGNATILAFVRMTTYPDAFLRTLASNRNWTDQIRLHHPLMPPLLRDIFGNPFRPIAIDPNWRTSTVLALATSIYEERAFDRMPILADALQDADCNDPDILNHCRHQTGHVRGCWVIDLLLGKQ